MELPSWAYMPSVAAMGINAPYGPSAMWPPRAAPTPQHPGTALLSPEDLPLFSNSGQVDIAQPAGRVAMWFAGRDSWMQAETRRRDDSSAQSRLDNDQQRRIDEFHNIQFTLGALQRREEQQRQETQQAAAPSPMHLCLRLRRLLPASAETTTRAPSAWATSCMEHLSCAWPAGASYITPATQVC